MHLIREHAFGAVRGFEMGFAPIGRPLMTVFFYQVDGLLIDTGQHHLQRQALEILASLPPIHRILITHHHEDHSGNAAAFRRHSGARLNAHPQAITAMARGFRIRPYQHLVWGRTPPVGADPLPDRIVSERVTLVPLHTPGHSHDHTVFWEPERGWLFAGDIYLGERIKFFRADEDIHAQIASLRRIRDLPFQALFCAHNPSTKNGPLKIGAKLDFLETLRERVRGLHTQGCGAREIITRLDPRQDRFVKWFTTGNASFANMVRSALRPGHDANFHGRSP
ncbi:MAG: MBL fold metallo-hydrolase [Desulfobacterales bacterium]|nr:MBL fold metallo-hydrolase [Desulfobacterales bacterium]MDJ0887553.1 MBL fold metallo-hydrolase [Desulfobacterales bacterium]MDJ0988490.1 MBL fold metallo-hydrolase [Desulfobacterales bacterium]